MLLFFDNELLVSFDHSFILLWKLVHMSWVSPWSKAYALLFIDLFSQLILLSRLIPTLTVELLKMLTWLYAALLSLIGLNRLPSPTVVLLALRNRDFPHILFFLFHFFLFLINALVLLPPSFIESIWTLGWILVSLLHEPLVFLLRYSTWLEWMVLFKSLVIFLLLSNFVPLFDLILGMEPFE